MNLTGKIVRITHKPFKGAWGRHFKYDLDRNGRLEAVVVKVNEIDIEGWFTVYFYYQGRIYVNAIVTGSVNFRYLNDV